MSLTAKSKILQRVVRDIEVGMTVNLGIGYPLMIAQYLSPQLQVSLHSENGVLGFAPVDNKEQANRNLIDAGGGYIKTMAGSVFFDSAVSFAIVRSGRLDLSLLGAFEVSQEGDLANWKIPGKFSPGIGGAIELAQKSRKVGVITTHVDKHGKSKIKTKCSLPITARACVDRIYTDYAVMDVTSEGLRLCEISENTTIDEVIKLTEAELLIDSVNIDKF